jgi:uncharacterized protein YigA (DUF484 family)
MRRTCSTCHGAGYLEVQGAIDLEELARRIIAEVAEDYQITPAILCGPSRKKGDVEARRYAAHELRRHNLPLKAIGRWLGYRDHSTILNLLNGKARRTGSVAAASDESTTKRSSSE